jgi:hypothetical protein
MISQWDLSTLPCLVQGPSHLISPAIDCHFTCFRLVAATDEIVCPSSRDPISIVVILYEWQARDQASSRLHFEKISRIHSTIFTSIEKVVCYHVE